MKICMFDSGIGGLHILSQCIKLCPNNEYIYFLDNKNCPYGNKSHAQLKRIIEDNVNYLTERFSPDLIVVACNTASVILSENNKLNRNLVLTLPRVKDALKDGFIKPLLFATKYTVEHYMRKAHIERTYINNMVDLIEDNLADLSVIKSKINFDCDALVLGCTHFYSLKPFIKSKYPDIKIYSSEYQTAKQVLKVQEKYGATFRSISIRLSKQDNTYLKQVYKYLKNLLEK